MDFIIGNPPFLGGGLIRSQLGDEYVEKMFSVYGDRIPNFSDLCCYWFEKARKHLEDGKCKRVGLLATQGIRGGANREVLKRIKESGDIFFAESDRDWVLDGANVHVSMVGFDNGIEKQRTLDSKHVTTINTNLSAIADITQAQPLEENGELCYMGPSPKAPFDVDESTARAMLAKTGNVHGKPNSDVIRRVQSGVDLTAADRRFWTIDFGLMPLEEAAKYEAPFEYTVRVIKPVRTMRKSQTNTKWWQYERPRIELRNALKGLKRFIATPEVAKHRIFVWRTSECLSNQQTLVFAREDDYFFGVLQSRAHEVWALKLGTRLETRPRYTPTTCFETFPFPDVGRVPDAAHIPPGEGTGPTTASGADAPHVAAIAAAAQELNALRERWLNPPEWTREEILEFPASPDGPWARYIERSAVSDHPARREAGSEQPAAFGLQPSAIGLARYPRLVPRDEACAAQLAQRTLTKLYNARPTWLQNAHAQLDAAVFAAYGWPADLSDDELLARLLKLNLERSAAAT